MYSRVLTGSITGKYYEIPGVHNYYNGFLKIFLLKYELFIFFFISPYLFAIIIRYKGGFTHELW